MSRRAATQAQARPSIEQLRLALSQLLAAERRLRSRDQHRSGKLTFAQVRSLLALGREREMTAGQLARSADLNPATVTAMLDQLEEAGIVQRQRSTEDRRVYNVSLTPEGWELLERKVAAWQAIWEEHMSELSDGEIETAERVIRHITKIYDSITPSSDSD
jgi:MarR family transcriptional regulator, organic hydroperoxide resistance regulator